MEALAGCTVSALYDEAEAGVDCWPKTIPPRPPTCAIAPPFPPWRIRPPMVVFPPSPPFAVPVEPVPAAPTVPVIVWPGVTSIGQFLIAAPDPPPLAPNVPPAATDAPP